jgi:site-specific DNA-cytosine methylase
MLPSLMLLVQVVWLAECDPRKQKFLDQQFSPDLLVADFQDMRRELVTDVRTGKEVLVPETHLLVAGFPCTQKSSLNTRASEFTNCIQLGEGPAGKGFDMVKQFTEAHKPYMFILENVPRLDTGGDQDESNFIKATMKTQGYAIRRFQFDARLYGSWAPRDRLYFAGWRDGVPCEAGECHSQCEHPFHDCLISQPLAWAAPFLFKLRYVMFWLRSKC